MTCVAVRGNIGGKSTSWASLPNSPQGPLDRVRGITLFAEQQARSSGPCAGAAYNYAINALAKRRIESN